MSSDSQYELIFTHTGNVYVCVWLWGGGVFACVRACARVCVRECA